MALAIVAAVLSSIGAVIATSVKGTRAIDQRLALTGAAETLLAELPARNLAEARPAVRRARRPSLADRRLADGYIGRRRCSAESALRAARRHHAAAGAGRSGRSSSPPCGWCRRPPNERRTRNARRAGEAGFTLIEVLVATLLMTVILAALATVTAQWLPNWNRGMARVQRAERLALGLDRVVADLSVAEMMPINGDAKVPLFEGTELAVTFVRTAVGPNTRPGLEIIRLVEKADSQGLALVRERAPFAPMAARCADPFCRSGGADPFAVSRDVFLCGAGSGLAAELARPDATAGEDPRHRARRRDRAGARRVQCRRRPRRRLGRMRAGKKCRRLPRRAAETGRRKKEEQL